MITTHVIQKTKTKTLLFSACEIEHTITQWSATQEGVSNRKISSVPIMCHDWIFCENRLFFGFYSVIYFVLFSYLKPTIPSFLKDSACLKATNTCILITKAGEGTDYSTHRHTITWEGYKNTISIDIHKTTLTKMKTNVTDLSYPVLKAHRPGIHSQHKQVNFLDPSVE